MDPDDPQKSNGDPCPIRPGGSGASLEGFKFRQITRPGFAIQKKLANRVLFGVEYHVQSGVIT